MDNLEWLYSLKGRGSVLGLEKIKELLLRLGNPEKDLKYVHVAGTNGKGSVCAIIASILDSHGYKTGMYTSPHLKRFSERFQINGEEITLKEADEILGRIPQFYTDQTFFEVATALAFLYFKEKNVDIAVLEVGLGGRLDATNVIKPIVSIITNISKDHTQILGRDEESIASEKAGIIKEGVPVVCAAKGKAFEVINKIAKEKGSIMHFTKRYKKKESTFDINSYKDLDINLRGEFQLENAAMAVTAVEILNEEGFNVSVESIKKGMGNIVWPGRLEFLRKNILVDCAHNPGATEKLKKEIYDLKKDYQRVISVVGILKDKDAIKMVRDISEFSDYIIFTRPDTHRATDPKRLSSHTDKINEVIPSVRKAFKKAKRIADPDDLIVVTGSIYTVGEVE